MVIEDLGVGDRIDIWGIVWTGVTVVTGMTVAIGDSVVLINVTGTIKKIIRNINSNPTPTITNVHNHDVFNACCFAASTSAWYSANGFTVCPHGTVMLVGPVFPGFVCPHVNDPQTWLMGTRLPPIVELAISTVVLDTIHEQLALGQLAQTWLKFRPPPIVELIRFTVTPSIKQTDCSQLTASPLIPTVGMVPTLLHMGVHWGGILNLTE